MVMENLTEATVDALVSNVASLTTFIQAIGGLIILYIIFGVINSILNRKKGKELKKINKNLEEIKVLLGGKERKRKKKK